MSTTTRARARNQGQPDNRFTNHYTHHILHTLSLLRLPRRNYVSLCFLHVGSTVVMYLYAFCTWAPLKFSFVTDKHDFRNYYLDKYRRNAARDARAYIRRVDPRLPTRA